MYIYIYIILEYRHYEDSQRFVKSQNITGVIFKNVFSLTIFAGTFIKKGMLKVKILHIYYLSIYLSIYIYKFKQMPTINV